MIATTEPLIPLQEFALSSPPTQDDPVFYGHPYMSVHCHTRPVSPAPGNPILSNINVDGSWSSRGEPWARAMQSPPAQEDFLKQLFGATLHGRQVCHLVTTALVITHKGKRQPSAYSWDAFIYNDTLFLRSPTIELGWTESEFRDSVVAVLELAEESTDCKRIVVAMEKSRADLNMIFRAFLYVGFEIVAPHIFNHDDRFLLVGYQI